MGREQNWGVAGGGGFGGRFLGFFGVFGVFGQKTGFLGKNRVFGQKTGFLGKNRVFGGFGGFGGLGGGRAAGPGGAGSETRIPGRAGRLTGAATWPGKAGGREMAKKGSKTGFSPKTPKNPKNGQKRPKNPQKRGFPITSKVEEFHEKKEVDLVWRGLKPPKRGAEIDP